MSDNRPKKATVYKVSALTAYRSITVLRGSGVSREVLGPPAAFPRATRYHRSFVTSTTSGRSIYILIEVIKVAHT